MPRQIVQIQVLRRTSTPDGAGGYTQTEAAISGSPFPARIYRRGANSGSSGFVAEAPGETNADTSVIVSFQSASAPVRVNDVVVLPDGSKARVLRVRRYLRHTQCDTVVGLE